MKKFSRLNLVVLTVFTASALVGCNGGSPANNANGNGGGNLANFSAQENNPVNKTGLQVVTANPSTLTPSSFTIKPGLNATQLKGGLKDDTPQGSFLNPVFGWALETTKNAVINKLKGFGIGLINTAVSELFGYFGINMGGSTPDPRFIQIENQMAAVNQKLDQIDTQLTSFYNFYATNIVNENQKNYNNIDSYIWQKYSTAANQIYATVPESYDQGSLEASWILGYLPDYSVEAAIAYNSHSIKTENTSFDPILLTAINNLSDDSGDTYFDRNGILTLSNNNGNWISTVGRTAVANGMFYTSLQAAFTQFKQKYPDYGDSVDNPNGTVQNYLYNKALWTQFVMRALYFNQTSLQRSYRIVDFLIDAKYGPSKITQIDLPSFMAGNNSKSYTDASNYLTAIYQFKTQLIYNEAIEAINWYQTGPKGSDLTDFIASSTCDDLTAVGQLGGASGESLSLQTLKNESANYGWDGKNITTKCRINVPGNRFVSFVTTTQDIGEMCIQGQLVNLNGNIYCSSSSPGMVNNSLASALGVINGTTHYGLNTVLAVNDSSYKGVNVENILGNTQIIYSYNSTGHLYTVNDEPGYLHLRDGDPKNNYFVILQDENHMYIYGESWKGWEGIFLQCIPHDSYCNFSSLNDNARNFEYGTSQGELVFTNSDNNSHGNYLQMIYLDAANTFSFNYGVH